MRNAVVLFLFVAVTALLCGSTAVCYQTTTSVNNNNNNESTGGGGVRKKIFLLKEDLNHEKAGCPSGELDAAGVDSGAAGTSGENIVKCSKAEKDELTPKTPTKGAVQLSPPPDESPEVRQEEPPTAASHPQRISVVITEPDPETPNSSASSDSPPVDKIGVKTSDIESKENTHSASHESLPDTMVTTKEGSKTDEKEKKEDVFSDNDNTAKKNKSEQNNAVHSDDGVAKKQSTSSSLPAEVNPTSTTTASNILNDAADFDIFGTVRGPFVLFLLLLQITF